MQTKLVSGYFTQDEFNKFYAAMSEQNIDLESYV